MRRWLALGAMAGVAACSGTPPRPPIATATATPVPQRVDTAARSCVELSRVREARVVDDRTIDFYLSGREVLRNRLPNSCSQLGFEKAFTYSTSLSKLCSVDIITVVIQGGGPVRGASCGLGSFVPYTPVPK